jgi:hypothetical protein
VPLSTSGQVAANSASNPDPTTTTTETITIADARPSAYGPPSRPSTPARGRRYPAELARGPTLGHVPLHRRGTSKTYERLEDLLREAGYKETRVVTPQADRVRPAPKTETETEPPRKSGVGAVVGFLAAFMPGPGPSNVAGEGDSGGVGYREYESSSYVPPPSPLARKQRLPDHRSDIGPPAKRHTLPTERERTADRRSDPHSASSRGTGDHDHEQESLQNSSQSIRPRPSNPNVRTYAEASQARVYLRHMASAPNIQRRRSGVALSATTLKEDPPPLPRGWLETVARAVLGGGVLDVGHVGGPAPNRRRESRSRSQSRDHKHKHRHRHLAPPRTMLMQRVHSSPGKVTAAVVVCRSAPGSRSASRAGMARAVSGAVGRGSLRGRRGRRGRDLPVLADTRTEGDIWTKQGGRTAAPGHGEVTEEEEDEEEEEGELDLARILVPPKRQQSIRSLRQHLHVERSQSMRVAGSRKASLYGAVGARGGVEEDEDENGDDGGSVWRGRQPRRVRGGGGEDDDDAEQYVFASNATGAGRRRQGIPGGWGQGR